MAEQFAELFIGIPAHWITFFISMLPIVELRGAIPWALTLGDLNWQQAFLWAIMGNSIPIIPLMLLLEPVSKWLRKIKIFDRFFEWLFSRTQKRGEKVMQKYKAFGLAIFVGIPLPGTGIWTGAVAAFVFGIPFRLALPAIIGGMLFAGAMVTLASVGTIGFINVIL
jgi:uncharacterized membrane protein